MARLFDKILANGIDSGPQTWLTTEFGVYEEGDIAERSRPRSILDVLRTNSMEVIVIDNVAEYFFTTSGKNPVKNWKLTDFPLISPPFDQFWMEFQKPGLGGLGLDARGAGLWFQGIDLFRLPDDEKFDLVNHPQIAKALAASRKEEIEFWEKENEREFPVTDPFLEMALDRATWWAAASQIMTDEPDPVIQAMVLRQLARTGIRWMMIVTAFIENRSAITGPIATWLIPVMDNGSQATGCYGPLISGLEGPKLTMMDNGVPLDHTESHRRLACYLLNPCLLGLSFMHSRGTQRRLHDPGTKDPKLARVYAKRHKRPLVRYKVLEIEAFRPRVARGEDSGHRTGNRVSLHIRRGYWGDYREHGLFGRASHKGVYWFEASPRGSADAGVVLHDYEVRGDKEAG